MPAMSCSGCWPTARGTPVPIPSSNPTLRQRGDTARLDAVVLEPLVSRYLLGGDDRATAVLRSASVAPEDAIVTLPGIGTTRIYAYGGTGHLMTQESSSASTLPATFRLAASPSCGASRPSEAPAWNGGSAWMTVLLGAVSPNRRCVPIPQGKPRRRRKMALWLADISRRYISCTVPLTGSHKVQANHRRSKAPARI